MSRTENPNAVSFFDPAARKAPNRKLASKYPPAVDPMYAPWVQILGRAMSAYSLDHYPEEALANALENFEEANERAADPTNPADFEEVQERTFTLIGWDK
ncbi:hypothetical protein M3672_09170 [Microbacterium enclense]|uniref:hypothetical protein n=1 Tax=Microbacterium enclense TaxID=993073 RepID=UPI0020424B6A|nr:hypothetical protein [Microbacterium enclense]MCM3614606.1 hypothetical protein [Microbacterium enclense]